MKRLDEISDSGLLPEFRQLYKLLQSSQRKRTLLRYENRRVNGRLYHIGFILFFINFFGHLSKNYFTKNNKLLYTFFHNR